jgi:putative phosphoribosyl transferase
VHICGLRLQGKAGRPSVTYLFTDRADAGRQLAAALPPLDPSRTVVVALPRGGVPVAEEICRAHHLPMDLVLVRKIGVPGSPEVALGAIVDGAPPSVSINVAIARSLGLGEADVRHMGQDLMSEIERRRRLYFAGVHRPDLRGKTLVVVDDGIATGATVRAGLLALGKVGAGRIILALPVAPPDSLADLSALADQTVCLNAPPAFHAVGSAYRNFQQVSDEAVIAALRRCAQAAPGPVT